MFIKRFRITAIDADLRNTLTANNEAVSWSIVANSMQSAWRKFVTQKFGVLKPNPADYDICLER